MRTLSHVYNHDTVTTRVWVPVCHLGPASRPRLWLPSADTSGSGLNLSLSRTQTWRTSTDHIIAPAHHPRSGGQGKGRGFQVSDIFNIYSTFKLQGYSLDIQLSSYKDIGYILASYSVHTQFII